MSTTSTIPKTSRAAYSVDQKFLAAELYRRYKSAMNQVGETLPGGAKNYLIMEGAKRLGLSEGSLWAAVQNFMDRDTGCTKKGLPIRKEKDHSKDLEYYEILEMRKRDPLGHERKLRYMRAEYGLYGII